MSSPLSVKISKSIFNDAYLPQLENYSPRFNVFYGGSGSGKSHFVISKIVYKCLKFPNRKVLVIRKVGNTLRDSVFALFRSLIADWHLYDKVEIRETLLTISFPNGSQILLKGLDDSEKIKSIANIDDIFVEEATEISKDEFDQLDLRLRSKNPYNQIHVCFNPVSKSNWVYKEWFENGFDATDTIVLHTTYKHNKFLPLDYIHALEKKKITNPIYYSIYALGRFATLDKLIFNNFKIEIFGYQSILNENKNVKAVFACDFGYANDPTALVCALIDKVDKRLWIFDEFQQKGLTNDEIADKIRFMGFQKEIIVCDSAEPKSIEELRRNGITRVKAAVKGKDSILNGIQYLQQFDIIINPKCKYIIDEFENYTWIKDKDGLYINKPVDKFNHGLDALRYATTSDDGIKPIKFYDRQLLGV